MDSQDERDQRIAELEERLSRLSAASLRISESLDFDTVLQEVVDGARALTASRYGAMTVLSDDGQTSDLIVSGVSDDERQGLLTMPQAPAFFAYLSGVEEPLRIADIDRHMSAEGMPRFRPPLPATSLLVAPIRHRGAGVGTIYLAHDEDDRRYTAEDEATLIMFASQAAMVIANARRHREEQRTRADLEALVDTSPVGVVVLDARSGAPRSFNREASRIVDRLRDPQQSPEELLETVTFRRADGRQTSLQEFQVSELLSVGETVRAEEIVLQVGDGRSVTVLLNATPIMSTEDVVESVIVTLQDMAAVEELEHLRAEFLAMVSHELRAPLSTIKGSASTVLDSAVDLDPAVVRQFFRIIVEQADHLNGLVSDLLDVARIETGELPVNPEPGEAVVLIDRARSTFANAGGGNPLQLDIEPDLPLVMADRRRIVQVLVNLLRNAGRNAPEGSLIEVSAAHADLYVVISVTDRGMGIPAESLPRLFRKFSGTRKKDSGGDTGLGLAICKGIIEGHGGRIWAESDGPGLGARFTFTLPTVEAAGIGAPDRSPLRDEGSEEPESQEQTRILAVNDDPQALRNVRDVLVSDGFEAVVTGEPQEALRLMTEEQPQLVLLDLVLAETDGIDLMVEMHRTTDVPVIFLSAYGRDELIARAFEKGASDYVVKPFSPTELLARIKAALRRREVSEPPPYTRGELSVNYVERQVTLAGEPLQLTPTEYRMLAELSANAGQVVSYERLLGRIWRSEGDADLRPMRTMMGKLRRKLGEDGDEPQYIFTEPRVGYRMPRSDTAEQLESPPAPAD